MMLNCIDNDDDSKNERVFRYNHYIQVISLLNMIMMLNCIDSHNDNNNRCLIEFIQFILINKIIRL